MTQRNKSKTGVVVFALSYQSLTGELPSNQKVQFENRAGEPVYLRPMTSLFRQAFRAIIDSATSFAVSGAAIEVAGAKICLTRFYTFATSGKGIGDGDRADQVLIGIAEVTPDSDKQNYYEVWRTHYRPVEAKLELLRKSGLGVLLDGCNVDDGRVIGHTSTPVEFSVKDREKTISAIFALYVVGWLSAMRITRRQLALKLAPLTTMSDGDSQAIADQRLRIINQQRYFLSNDHTNDLDLREFCQKLAEKYKLRERYDRALELHEAFEHHLDNSSKLYSAKQLGSVSNLILILTVLSVPISAFSAIFAINLKSEVMDKPWHILSDQRLYVTLFIGAMWVAVPFIVLKLADRIRKL